ncbi:MAG: Crp/Fnr family transcriptional regulator [Flavitalea sp.]
MLRTNKAFFHHIEHLYNEEKLKQDVVIRNFRKGELLLEQDQPAKKVMLIREGITKCYFSEANDKEYIVEFLGQGEILSEIEVIRNTNCLCNIQAITDGSVFAISIPYFRKLIQTDLQLNNLLLNEFAERLVNTAKRASYQQLYPAEHNLAKLRALMETQKLQISKEDMSAYLGITLRSLNRALKSKLFQD